MFQTFLSDEAGATAIEYALIASMIAVAILGALSLLSQNTSALFETVSNGVAGTTAAPSS